MTQRLRISLCILIFPLLVVLILQSDSAAQDSQVANDGWVQQQDERSGIVVKTKELVIYPKAESKPSLKHRLLVDEFDAVPGNAAIHFLKATGFFEQPIAHRLTSKFIEDSYATAKREEKDIDDVPPWVWLLTPPDSLPLEEVKEYLRPLQFQLPSAREAARRTRFDLDRNFRVLNDPVGYPLPEIQGSRELARTQSLRCRVAIAENRIGDAIEIVGQQFAMARQLGQDDFLVSALVGMGFAVTGWNDMLHLVQHPETPNLYWALATMPRPLVDIRHTMSVERQFLYQQCRVLQEVSAAPQTDGYWRDFIERLLPQLGSLGKELEIPAYDEDPEAARAALLGHIEAASEGAKEFLITEQMMPRDQVEAYPKAQVVFLAMVRYYDQWRDEFFKWTHVPFWQVRLKVNSSELEEALQASSDRYGWFAQPTLTLVPGVLAARAAEARCDQNIALVQTVECLRMHAAAHNGSLPRSLNELAVPAPIEPFTGQPIQYQLDGENATISGHDLPGLKYKLVVTVAE